MSSLAPKSLARVLALAGVALLLAAPAAGAAQRVASPTGSGTDCTSDAPCGFKTAIADALNNDDVLVRSGHYAVTGSVKNPFGTTITVHGEDPLHPPVITSTASTELEIDDPSTTIKSLDLRDTNFAGDALNFSGARADGILARAAGASGACVLSRGTLADTVCVATNPLVAAIQVNGFAFSASSATVISLRNVTAIATDPSSFGLFADERSSVGAVTIALENTIVRGGGGSGSFDIIVNNNLPGANLKVTTDHSNYVTTKAVGVGSPDPAAPNFNANYPKIIDTVPPSQQTATPFFVDAANLDFHELPNSPTRGAGLRGDALDGPYDFDGEARANASDGAVDIGADQHYDPVVPPPTTSTATTTPPPTTTTPPPPTTTPTATAAVDRTPPVVSSAGVSPTKFAVKLARQKHRRGVKYGSTLKFQLSERATVVGSVALKSTGRLVGKTCKKQTGSNRKKKKCTLWVSKGSMKQASVAGTSKVQFTGRVSGHNLAKGSYRVQLVATDPSGNKSRTLTLNFAIQKG
jgi:hypothetical protein